MKSFFLHFPTDRDNIQNIILNQEIGISFIKSINMIFDRIDCEKNTKVFYHSSNKRDFYQELNVLDDLIGNLGSYSFTETIDYLIYENTDIVCWENNSYSNNNIIYKQWITENQQIINDDLLFVKEITERSYIYPQHEFYIVTFIKHSFPFNDKIKILRDDKESCPKFFCFSVFNTFSLVDEFFCLINKSRVLNKEDFRHCDNHLDFIFSKSPLIGGVGGFDNAEVWLPSAIGDKRVHDFLICFDEAYNRIIRFEDENFNNQFHAFHLVKQKTYESDIINIEFIKSQIPRVFQLLEYRDELKKSK